LKKEEAKDILQQLGLPTAQTNDMCCYVLLTLAGIQEKMPWKKVSDTAWRIHDIITFMEEKYDIKYAENSRETIRKVALRPFRAAAIVEDTGEVTNSPNFKYRLTMETVRLLRTYGTKRWKDALEEYKQTHDSLKEVYRQHRTVKKIPILINGQEASLSLGVHNKLQKAILDDFAAIFAQGSRVLYIGDTQTRFLYQDNKTMQKLGICVLDSMTLPDIILYHEQKNWVYFIEAVTSVGPMTPARVQEIRSYCKNCQAGLIFVTAFPHLSVFKKFVTDLAWDTEVWIAEMPDHMIHLNGDKFLGPRL
jgi:hypothetical protein